MIFIRTVHSGPNNTDRKLQFYRRILESDLLVVLQNSDFAEDRRPSIFDTQEENFLLCFDSKEKLTNFITHETAHVLLPFKEILELIKSKKIGIALNIDNHSGILLDSKTVEWKEQVLSAGQVEELRSISVEFEFPTLVNDFLLSNLKIVLETMVGMARRVVLA